MSTPLLDIAVRSDWREITQRVVKGDARLWTAMRFAVIGVAIAAQLLALIFAPWGMAIRAAGFCALFWALPLWALWQGGGTIERNGGGEREKGSGGDGGARRGRGVIIGVAVAVGAAIVAALVVLPLIAPATIAGLATIVGAATVAGLALIAVGAAAAILLRRQFPHEMRAFGLVSDAWGINLAIGAALGVALGFHLLIVASALPGVAIGLRLTPALAVFIGFQVGLRVVGEELFFRGLGFHLLTGIGARSRALTAWLVLINLFVYLWLFGQTEDPVGGLLVLYGGIMAFVCTRLRLRQESLLPGLACQAIFVLFVAAVIRL